VFDFGDSGLSLEEEGGLTISKTLHLVDPRLVAGPLRLHRRMQLFEFLVLFDAHGFHGGFERGLHFAELPVLLIHLSLVSLLLRRQLVDQLLVPSQPALLLCVLFSQSPGELALVLFTGIFGDLVVHGDKIGDLVLVLSISLSQQLISCLHRCSVTLLHAQLNLVPEHLSVNMLFVQIGDFSEVRVTGDLMRFLHRFFLGEVGLVLGGVVDAFLLDRGTEAVHSQVVFFLGGLVVLALGVVSGRLFPDFGLEAVYGGLEL